MFLLHITRFALAATVTASPATSPAPVVADSQPILTVDALTHLGTFWTNFEKLPDSIKTTGRKANQEKLSLQLGQQRMPLQTMNVTAMATKYPAVAEVLKQSGLTAQEWEDYRIALFTATVAQQVGAASSAPATSALGKNVAFLAAHQQEFSTLQATGMWFPKAQTSGGRGSGADNLSP